MRQKLLSNPNFSIMDSYKNLDQGDKGHITANDVSFLHIILFLIKLFFHRLDDSSVAIKLIYHIIKSN